MCNPGSQKRVIRISYLYTLILDFGFHFLHKPVFFYLKVSKKENLNSSSSFMNNRVST